MFQVVPLPTLSPELTDKLIKLAKDLFYDEELQRQWITTRPYPFSTEILDHYNIVERISFNIGDYIDLCELKAIMEPALPIEATYQLFIMRNIRPNRKAIFPAHTDRKRGVALNYLLQSGGENVKLHFHEPAASVANTFFNEINAPIRATFDTPLGAWGALDATDIHSVTGIEGDRIIFTLSPCDQTLSYHDFLAKMMP
jgi:hypothetical protein